MPAIVPATYCLALSGRDIRYKLNFMKEPWRIEDHRVNNIASFLQALFVSIVCKHCAGSITCKNYLQKLLAKNCSRLFQIQINVQRFSQLLGTGGVGALPPRRGFTPAPRIQTARKVLYLPMYSPSKEELCH